jgi:hypothetical protein
MWYDAPSSNPPASNPINLLKKPPPALQMIGFAAPAQQTTPCRGRVEDTARGWRRDFLVVARVTTESVNIGARGDRLIGWRGVETGKIGPLSLADLQCR